MSGVYMLVFLMAACLSLVASQDTREARYLPYFQIHFCITLAKQKLEELLAFPKLSVDINGHRMP